jgi:hypothetical protein
VLTRSLGLTPVPGHPSDRRQSQPGKISCKGGRRPSHVTRSALVGDLARLHTGAPGGWPALAARAPGADRCGARPVRRAAGTARAPTPPWPGGPKSGWRRPGAQRSRKVRPVTGGSCAALRSALSSRGACQKCRLAGPGALRAPLKTYRYCSPVLGRHWVGTAKRPVEDALSSVMPVRSR